MSTNPTSVNLSTSAEIHLTRAYGFIHEVEIATEDFRQSAMQYDAQVDADQPFLQGIVSSVRGGRQLNNKKSSLINDLVLAGNEIESAARADSNAVVETREGVFGAKELRALVQYMRGQLELISGSNASALLFFNNSLQLTESPGAHYMLGLIYESEYKPTDALRHFERCLDLDPAGELSVPALREASAMRNYRKHFRGSWGVVLLFLVLFFPFAIVYFLIKWK